MAKTAELRIQVLNQIVNAIESNDVLPWRRSWATSKNVGLPRNVISKRTYSGINPISLEVHRMTFNFGSKWFGTFRQWEKIGGRVKRRPSDVKPGAWSAKVIFYSPIERTVVDRKTGVEKKGRFLFAKSASVFNADQVEGVEEWQSGGDLVAGEWEADFAPAEELIAASGAEIRHGGERAYYTLPQGDWPSHTDGDFITMPNKERFDPPGSYYETLLHELAHWSEVRTGWNSKKEGYAKSELAAELAASFLSTELGVPHGEQMENHAAYLKGWLDRMKADPSFLFQASSQASKVADYLLSFVQEPVLEEVADAA